MHSIKQRPCGGGEALSGMEADANKANDNGETPLYIASYNGHVEVVKVLAESGADINKADSDGLTPLEVARSENHTDVIEILLEV